MHLLVDQSLLDPRGGSATAEAALWVEGLLVGELALPLCVIAVALVGALMLDGRLALQKGIRVVLGCSFLLGALAIAAGIVTGGSALKDSTTPPALSTQEEKAPRGPLPPAHNDPFAGA